MTTEVFKKILEESPLYFEGHKGAARTDHGWKLSIQGTTMEDICYLYEHLRDFLLASNCSFKFGTPRLFEAKRPEQRSKILTIYVPNGVEVKSFAELVYLNIKDYEGGEDVEPKVGYERYKNAIFYRNDRDINGQYVYPEDSQ